VKHSRDTGILRVNEFTRELSRKIDTCNRFSHNLVVFRVLGRNFRRHFHVPADSGGGDSDVEPLAAEKISDSVRDYTWEEVIARYERVLRAVVAEGPAQRPREAL